MFGPLSNTDAEYLARCLALGINRPISDEAVATVVAITDGFPSLIQTLFVMMKYEPDGSSTAEKAINAEEIKQKLDDFIDDRNHSQDVTHYVTRIDLYYGDSVNMAHSILDIMAQGTGSISFRDINEQTKDNMGSEFIQKQFIAAYNNLCDDHYLIENRTDDDYEVMWRYQILREIYIRRGKKF